MKNKPFYLRSRERKQFNYWRRSYKGKLVRFVWYIKQLGRCYYCKRHMKRNELSWEHIIPLSVSKDNSLKNIKLTHIYCNALYARAEQLGDSKIPFFKGNSL